MSKIKEIEEAIKTHQMVLRFSPTAWAKLLFMQDKGKTEVGGFGITKANDLLYVEDFILPKQKCSFVSVKFDDESVADFVNDMVDKGRNTNQCLRIWLHTHPNISAHPSETDEDTFKRVFGNCDWAIMGIISSSGENYCRLQVNVGPFPGRFIIPIEVDYQSYDFDASNIREWEKEYNTKVCEEILFPNNWFYKHWAKDNNDDNVPEEQNHWINTKLNDDDNIINLTSDFDIDIPNGIPSDLLDMLNANQLSLLINMSEEDREYTINDLKEKLKIGD